MVLCGNPSTDDSKLFVVVKLEYESEMDGEIHKVSRPMCPACFVMHKGEQVFQESWENRCDCKTLHVSEDQRKVLGQCCCHHLGHRSDWHCWYQKRVQEMKGTMKKGKSYVWIICGKCGWVGPVEEHTQMLHERCPRCNLDMAVRFEIEKPETAIVELARKNLVEVMKEDD